jgi:signal transduction histidine kinase
MAKFRTSARTVDMLGRQQIAGVPTAISELFKNAHDAYATEVAADLLREQDLLVVRDNGRGMSREDFEDRWLVLGTDSKLEPPKVPRGFKRREMLGEKGIGRLAIALLGRQVLVLTRPKEGRTGGELTVSLIDWRLFEVPGVALDDVDIPLKTLPPGHLPQREDINTLKEQLLKNAETLIRDGPALRTIQEQTASFWDDIPRLDAFLGSPSVSGDGYGTHFVVAPIDDAVFASLRPGSKREVSELLRLLIGFTNTMVPDHPTPGMEVSFNDHQALDTVVRLVDENEFFTPAEFNSADHRVRGAFDESGWFRGIVSIYGQDPQTYEVAPPKNARSPIRCGPFDFALAVVQPERKSTTLSPEQHAALLEKTRTLGSLYVYRDGIRVLPYGDIDNDWLQIEKRRTLQAKYYYFSHRNMFGAASITSAHNRALVDKAGREGFQKNAAYRDFVVLLENLFTSLAADFFRETGSRSEHFFDERARLQELHRARDESEKRSKAARARLASDLSAAAGFLDDEFEDAVAQVRALVERTLAKAASGEDLVRMEAQARRLIEAIRSRLVVREPEGVGLGEALTDRLNHLNELAAAAEHESLAPLERWMTGRFQDAAGLLAESDALKWATEWASSVVEDAQARVQPIFDGVESQLVRLSDEIAVVKADVTEALTRLRKEFDSVAKDAGNAGSDELREARWSLIEGVAAWDSIDDTLSGDLALLELLSLDSSAVSPKPMAAMRALEEELIAHRERAQVDVEMIQLGMAVDVLSHEFDDSIRAVRGNLRRLSAWANENPDLVPLYGDLVSSFEHLDGYLKLLTPLARRLYRSRSTVTGKEILRYVSDLFRDRLEKEEVRLDATKAFEAWSAETFRSTFYPVFVNLIDNALFWLADARQPKRVLLDANGVGLRMCDSGPGIPDRDIDRIFDRGFTRKPGGRGLGLYISRQVLAEEGFSIRAEPKGALDGACFIIEREPDDGA